MTDAAMSTGRIALVLGATGGIGAATAKALVRHGWAVRALTRRPLAGDGLDPTLAWTSGDAMNADDVARAARGADLIVHAVNPPRYRNWRDLALPMLDATIAAARRHGARILFPGTVYNYGPGDRRLLHEDTPQRPTTRKGAIRVEMEESLRRAAESGVPVLIVRAGDFFGPSGGNTWFAQGMVTPGKQLRRFVDPGAVGAGHAWAYLPDLAETMAQLLDRADELAPFERFHFRGHWFARNRDLAEAVRHAVGDPTLPIWGFPWWLVTLTSPVVRLFREMHEMRYIWRESIELDNTKLVAFLGEEPRTPIDVALRQTLEALECLSPAAQKVGRDLLKA